MGRYDKDRFQKELAIRYAIARGHIPFLEVVVKSASDLSETVELLTDLDVLSVDFEDDGGQRRTIYDCKTTNKMSSINRAFWAGGVRDYTGCEEAFVILKNRAVQNHRISALAINVDLHDEESFRDLGKTLDPAFPADIFYQSSVSRWGDVYEVFMRHKWAESLFDLSRNTVPLSKAPWVTFRKILAELRGSKGNFDPEKSDHIAIFLDVAASVLVLWAAMARDIRRIYDPKLAKHEFVSILRYYLWGGKESYNIRQQMRDKAGLEAGGSVELPAWETLISFCGLIVSAPQGVKDCAFVCRELSIKTVCGKNNEADKAISNIVNSNTRVRQFAVALIEYLVIGCGLPKDMSKKASALLLEL